MDAALQSLAEFIARHAAWAGLVLGVVTMLESLVLIGAFIPATALMVMAGGLIAAGVLDPVQVVLWCVAGAIVGDAVSFELGRRLGPGGAMGGAGAGSARAANGLRRFAMTEAAGPLDGIRIVDLTSMLSGPRRR